MADWLFTWKGYLSGAIILLGAVVFAIIFREESTLGNIAGIVGLVVSVLGFIVTIWTVADARQQIKEAGVRAERAITRAAEESRRAVEGIAAQLRAADCGVLRSGIEDLRQAAQDAKWARAIYRCQECRLVAYRLAHDRRLTDAEASGLRRAADDLLLILRFRRRRTTTSKSRTALQSRPDGSGEPSYEVVVRRLLIERNRRAKETGSLQDQQIQKLDGMIGLLTGIQGRLHHEPLRSAAEPTDQP